MSATLTINDQENTKLKILALLKTFRENNGFMPSLGEAGDLLGLTKQRVQEQMLQLEGLGLLKREYALTRAISFCETGNQIKIPECEWRRENMLWGNIIKGVYISKEVASSGLVICARTTDSFVSKNIFAGDRLTIKLESGTLGEPNGLFVAWDPQVGKRLVKIEKPTKRFRHLLMTGRVLQIDRCF